MDTGKFVGLLVFGIIGMLLCVAFIPMIQDTTSATDTYHNEGYFRMTHYGTDEEITLTWDASEKQVIVNDVVIPIDYNVVGGAVTLVADTNFIARLNTPNTGDSLSFIGYTGGTHTATTSAEYVFSGGTVTVTNVAGDTTTTYTDTYEDLYIPSLDGPFIMKKYDKSAYLNEDSDVFAYGLTRINNASGTIPSPGAGFEFSGSIEDGITGRVWRGSANVSVSDEQINYSSVSSHIDLYSFDSITATATYTETVEGETVTTDTQITYNYLIVPYEVTAERTIHADNTLATIINLLPLIAVIGLFMFLVGEFLYTRYL